MHEMSIAAGILSAAELASEGRRIKSVSIVLGELAGIDDESLRLCWELISEDTCCSGASLDIRYIYADLKCLECGKVFPLRSNRSLLCPECGGEGRLTDRTDMQYIEAVELYDDHQA
ncbi:MAG: hydrogenase maturation nickel metallochaperone HypA [Abditibacteriota bacterium]|nr:hydrogenase maturation nickel metallochaperone HypA [Abditibacteriota bacterium]